MTAEGAHNSERSARVRKIIFRKFSRGANLLESRSHVWFGGGIYGFWRQWEVGWKIIARAGGVRASRPKQKFAGIFLSFRRKLGVRDRKRAVESRNQVRNACRIDFPVTGRTLGGVSMTLVVPVKRKMFANAHNWNSSVNLHLLIWS